MQSTLYTTDIRGRAEKSVILKVVISGDVYRKITLAVSRDIGKQCEWRIIVMTWYTMLYTSVCTGYLA